MSKRFVPFAYGFRPFFLLAGFDALFNMALWLAVYLHPGLWPEGAIPAVYWHGHEMLFGFVAAAIGGFLLTAVPGWTGRPRIQGAPLALLVAIWLFGRIAMLPIAAISSVVRATLDLAFFPALVVALAPSLIAARKLRNLPFIALLASLFVADLLFHLGRLGALDGGEFLGLGLATDIVMILIAVIGGRIIPGFTRGGLDREGIATTIGQHPVLDAIAIVSVLAVLAGDVLAPQSQANGAIALVAGAAQAARLSQWQGLRSLRVPLVWVLHLGYAWLAAGLLLKGIWLIWASAFAAKWLHALTIGAFTTMILAVTTRAALGHTGRPLVAPGAIVPAYLLVTVAAAARVFGGAIFPDGYEMAIAVAGSCWIAGFGLYEVVYAPILVRPRVDGKPG